MGVSKGNLKAIRKNMQKGKLKWELYDLDKDPAELIDISEDKLANYRQSRRDCKQGIHTFFL
jgi:hypothetical protein